VIAEVGGWTIELVTAGSRLLSGVVSAAANTWLANRAKLSEELRQPACRGADVSNRR